MSNEDRLTCESCEFFGDGACWQKAPYRKDGSVVNGIEVSVNRIACSKHPAFGTNYVLCEIRDAVYTTLQQYMELELVNRGMSTYPPVKTS